MEDKKEKSILDVFIRITEKNAGKSDMCVKLCGHIHRYSNKIVEESLNELRYSLKRLICGLSSPRVCAKKCYFATLVSLLRFYTDDQGKRVTLDLVKEVVDKHLSKFESKGEEGELLIGRVLTYQACIRSKIFFEASSDVQTLILNEIMGKCNERSYLPLLSYITVVEYVREAGENLVKNVLWPVIKDKILVGWPSQTMETLYCLLEVSKCHPTLTKAKITSKIFQTPSILHPETIGNVFKMLTVITWEPTLQHPLYDVVAKMLAENADILDAFWKEFEEAATAGNSSRMMKLALLNLFRRVISFIDAEKLPRICSSSICKFVLLCVQMPPSLQHKTDKLVAEGKLALQAIADKMNCKPEPSSACAYEIACNLIFDNLLLEKLTGIKIVNACLAKLDEKGVKNAVGKCQRIVLAKEGSASVKERIYAARLLSRLVGHSSNLEWKMKKLTFLLEYGVFKPVEEGVAINNDLADVLKTSLLSALDHQLSNMDKMSQVLSGLIENANTGLKERTTRSTLSQEVLSCWNETYNRCQRLRKKVSSDGDSPRKTICRIFLVMFQQMQLYLLMEPDTAMEILKELNVCYKKERIQSKEERVECVVGSGEGEEETPWIVTIVNLFLSLLTRDTHLLRRLICKIFPQLCPHLNAQAAYQILQALDPNAAQHVISSENETSEDDGDEMSVGDDVDEDEEEEEEDDTDLEESDVEESAIEKTRRAVREALNVAGSVTDTESVDMDDVDEEEGKKLDAALSEAFAATLKRKESGTSKKPTAGQKAVMAFRARVLDLVDVYVEEDPCLPTILDTLPVLFRLLEFCMKDGHQKALEGRVRGTLKKIGSLKKCKIGDGGGDERGNGFANGGGACENGERISLNKEALVSCIGGLAVKGVRTAPTFLGAMKEITDCCAFLARMAAEDEGAELEVIGIYKEALKGFFTKRDCLLSVAFFQKIFQLGLPDLSLSLCKMLPAYAFDGEVRGFRRNQALSLMSAFFKSRAAVYGRKLRKRVAKSCANFLQKEDFNSLKVSFTQEFLTLLRVLKGMGSEQECPEVWETIKGRVASLPTNTFGRKLAAKLGISVKNSNLDVVGKNNDKKRKINDVEGEERLEMEDIPEKNMKNENKKRKSGKPKEKLRSKELRATLATNFDVISFSTTNGGVENSDSPNRK